MAREHGVHCRPPAAKIDLSSISYSHHSVASVLRTLILAALAYGGTSFMSFAPLQSPPLRLCHASTTRPFPGLARQIASCSARRPLALRLSNANDFDDDEDLFSGESERSSSAGTQIVGVLDDGTPVLLAEASSLYRIDVSPIVQPGTESLSSTLVTTVKVILGGVAPLFVPWTIRKEGLIGGPLAVTFVGLLCAYTVRQLVEYKDAVTAETGRDDLTYVDVADHAFGPTGALLVLCMTALSSLGIVGAYFAFIGPTLSTLAAAPDSFVHSLRMPELSPQQYELATAAVIVPLNSLAGQPRFISLAAYLGALGVGAAVFFTCVYGLSVTPDLWGAVARLPLFTSPGEVFESAGVVTLLFSFHFAVFPIEKAMQKREAFSEVVLRASWFAIVANMVFGVLGFSFFGEDTSSVILDNVKSGAATEVIRLLLVFDMVVSAPIVLSSLREILETAAEKAFHPSAAPGKHERAQEEASQVGSLGRVGIRGGLVMAAYGIAQSGNIEVIANLVGGVAMGVLTFIVPPALALVGSRKWKTPGEAAGSGGMAAKPLAGVGPPRRARAGDALDDAALGSAGEYWDVGGPGWLADLKAGSIMAFGVASVVATIYTSFPL